VITLKTCSATLVAGQLNITGTITPGGTTFKSAQFGLAERFRASNYVLKHAQRFGKLQRQLDRTYVGFDVLGHRPGKLLGAHHHTHWPVISDTKVMALSMQRKLSLREETMMEDPFMARHGGGDKAGKEGKEASTV
jgi:hypothetical protein